MKFDSQNYLEMLKDPKTRRYAEDSLEFAIRRASITDAIDLKKLRTPGRVVYLELQNLRKAGFDENEKTPDGECRLLVMAYKAGADHAKKYWSENIAKYYNMDNYAL